MNAIREQIEEFATANQTSILLADGLDDALVGLGRRFNDYVAVYDRERVVQVLMQRDDMSREDAEEFFEYNIVGAYVGESTPVFLEIID